MTIEQAIRECIKEYDNLKAEDPSKIFLAGYLHGLNCVMDFDESPNRDKIKEEIDNIQYRLDKEAMQDL